jgi:hypothetical protein
MSQKKYETSMGVLKYRTPTIIENMKLMKSAKEYFISNDPIGAKICIMENMGPLLDFSEMNGVSSFDELNAIGDEMTMVMSEIADDVLNRVVGAFSKKSSSGTV